MTTGSLGQGASSAAGIALGNKLSNKDSYVYLILGDGECDEGQIWEAALFAPQFKLDHLIAFVDCNKQQLDGYTKDICDLKDLAAKFDSFGWYVQDVDGHDVKAIYDAIKKAKKEESRPSMIILNTIKGKGWSRAEGNVKNHNMIVSEELLKEAQDEFSQALCQLES